MQTERKVEKWRAFLLLDMVIQAPVNANSRLSSLFGAWRLFLLSFLFFGVSNIHCFPIIFFLQIVEEKKEIKNQKD